MSVKRMNGLPLNTISMCDFNDPTKQHSIARHTSIDAAERGIRRTIRGGVTPYGWTWVKALGGVDVEREVIAKSQRPWLIARDRAKAEGSHAFALTPAPCCPSFNVYEFGSHRATVRHFRYWVVDHRDEAIRLWPWIRDVIATEILSGVGE